VTDEPISEERRVDLEARERVGELLELIRDFYTTCHMVAVGQLEPSKAKAKAREVESRLDDMVKEMISRVEPRSKE
jgi:hypothetical protein